MYTDALYIKNCTYILQECACVVVLISGHVVGQRHPRQRERRSGRDQGGRGRRREQLSPQHGDPERGPRWEDLQADWWTSRCNCWPATEVKSHTLPVSHQQWWGFIHVQFECCMFLLTCWCLLSPVCQIMMVRWRSQRSPPDHWFRISSTMMWVFDTIFIVAASLMGADVTIAEFVLLKVSNSCHCCLDSIKSFIYWWQEMI